MYIPHISLFRIINAEVFEKHKENIEDLIHKKLDEIKNEDLFHEFYLKDWKVIYDNMQLRPVLAIA